MANVRNLPLHNVQFMSKFAISEKNRLCVPRHVKNKVNGFTLIFGLPGRYSNLSKKHKVQYASHGTVSTCLISTTGDLEALCITPLNNTFMIILYFSTILPKT